jgi:hypothetical protein
MEFPTPSSSMSFKIKYVPDPPAKDAPGGPRIACGVIVKQ